MADAAKEKKLNREPRDAAKKKELNREPDKEPEVVRISVRALVEFILRSGDIDTRTGGMPEKDAMQLGSRLHRKIQGRMGAEYQAEVPLRWDFPCEDFLIRIEGRADGIITRKTKGQEPEFIIDEIKGILRSVEWMEEPIAVHLAQARCYAWLYLLSAGQGEDRERTPSRIGVRMSYANLETEQMRYFEYTYSAAELEAWFQGVLEEYKKWASFERKWRRTRQASIRKIDFPFAYRPGQRELAGYVYRTIAREKLLFLQAPTGVGKTISTVFPAIKAIGEGRGDKLFYLTAKTSARTVAAQALEQLRAQGLSCKSVILTAKEKICRCETPECNPQVCPYAKGHYDRINQALYELITQEDVFDRERIEAASDQYMVCPFELSLDLSTWMDAIIADYNYVFHPRARLRRFFGENQKGDYLFLIDEAHNLVDRGREMYSAALIKEDFLALKREVKELSPRLARALEQVNRRLLELKRECDHLQVLEGIGTLPLCLLNLSGVMEDFLEETASEADAEAVREKVRELYFQVLTFLDTAQLLDEHYVIYDEILPDHRFMLRLFCVNPSANLQACMDKARSSILFSATLLPIDYYIRLLTTQKEPYAVYAKSIFSPEKLKVLIGADISSRYKRRNAGEYQKAAAYIHQTVLAKAGNYLVFFSSYKMLEDVAAAYRELLAQNGGDSIRLLLQRSGMKEEEREAFLEEFRRERSDSLVGFCVMGSIFGEGIDLREDRLIGAIVVGPGLPMVCSEQEILKDYYEKQGQDGFRFAYQCPGMNKVLQAAGRVIRTEEDTGVVLLLDERFLEPRYRQMFPREWLMPEPVTLRTVGERLLAFWNR